MLRFSANSFDAVLQIYLTFGYVVFSVLGACLSKECSSIFIIIDKKGYKPFSNIYVENGLYYESKIAAEYCTTCAVYTTRNVCTEVKAADRFSWAVIVQQNNVARLKLVNL